MSRMLIPNTAQIPNVLFDVVMARVSPAQFKVLMAVARKTYGWGKESDRISLSQLQQMTGLSRQGVIDAVAGLGWIINAHQRPQSITEYSINIDSANELVKSVDQGSQVSLPEVVNSVYQCQSTQLTRVVKSVDQSSQLSGPELVNSVDIQNPIKPTNKTQEEEERALAQPEAFDDLGLGERHPARIVGVEDWLKLEAFWKSRNKAKNIYQLEAYGLKLKQLKAEGHDPAEVVRKALRSGWMDLFGKEDTKVKLVGGAAVLTPQEMLKRARERAEKVRAQA